VGIFNDHQIPTTSMDRRPKRTKRDFPPATKFDTETARRIHAIGARRRSKSRLFVSKRNEAEWTNEIRLLRAEVNDDTDRITAAVDWYEKHGEAAGVYPVRTPAGIRSWWFDMTEERMMKAKRKGEGVEISKDAERVIHNVKGLGWRAGRAKLPAAVQVTTDNRNEFVRRLTTWAEFYDKTVKTSTDRRAKADADRRLGVLRLMLSRAGPTAVDFGVRWFHRVHDTIANWDEWSGEFSGFVFDTANDYTAKWGQKVCQQYSGRSGDWDSIVMEALR
jgi:hypothetical protein